jgi:hypothetical protein
LEPQPPGSPVRDDAVLTTGIDLEQIIPIGRFEPALNPEGGIGVEVAKAAEALARLGRQR